MSIQLSLSKDREITITNEHEVFAGSEFSEGDFTIRARALTQTKMGEIRRRNTLMRGNSQMVDDAAVDRDTFVSMVTGWEGIESESGPIDCTKETKELIANQQWAFAGKVIAAVIVESQKITERRESQLKN